MNLERDEKFDIQSIKKGFLHEKFKSFSTKLIIHPLMKKLTSKSNPFFSIENWLLSHFNLELSDSFFLFIPTRNEYAEI